MRRAAILWIIEARSSCVWVSAVVTHVQIFNITNEAVVLNRPISIFKRIIASTTHWSATIGEFTSSILFVWLVQSVSVVISCLLSSTTYSRMSARIGIHSNIGLMLREVTNIKLLLLLLGHILIAVHRLLASVVAATRILVITSLVKLIHLIDGIVVLSCILTELTLVTLMDWIASTSRCSLLTELGLSNCFGNW